MLHIFFLSIPSFSDAAAAAAVLLTATQHIDIEIDRKEKELKEFSNEIT